MTPELVKYKQTFRVMLLPIMDLLEHKKNFLSDAEWIKFIRETKSMIMSNPEHFMGKDLPRPLLIRQIIQEIFADYLGEQGASKTQDQIKFQAT